MRGIGFLVSLLPAITAIAQNWALLNPAYRYNYSNDGTDTISNQIRVMDVDTLGVDSFRYELNLITRVCDTCATTDLLLLVDQPQFMQRRVRAGATVWHFHDPASMVILPQSTLGQSWLFDTLANVMASVSAVDVVQVFGNDVARKVIDLSDGSVISISEDLGVLSWGDHQLIGVHGPDLGTLIPSLAEIFPYQTGDVVEYSIEVGGMDGFSSNFGHARLYKFTVESGDVVDGSMTFNGEMVDHRWNWVSYWGGPVYVTSGHQTLLGDTWSAGRPELPWADLLTSYPGQLIGHQNDVEWWTDTLLCVAHHGIDDQGRYFIGCMALHEPGQWENFGYFMHAPEEPLPSTEPVTLGPQDHCPAGPNGECGVLYTEGIGLNWLYAGYFESFEQYALTGIVLNGDTTGTIHSDEYIIGLSMPEADRSPFVLQPNPAADRITLVNAAPGSSVRISDTHGRLVRRIRVGSASETIDVRDLVPGIYFVDVEGGVPQRLMIMR